LITQIIFGKEFVQEFIQEPTTGPHFLPY
jgi:hypothetical protein